MVGKAAWGLAARVGFRFCFAYLALFNLLTQVGSSFFPIPKVEIPDLGSLPPFRQIVFWTAHHVFRVKGDVVYTGSGSGDKTFDWVLTFCVLVAAVAATMVWSALDRNRTEYATLYKWFRVFIRCSLFSQMFVYGLDKAIPLQMPFPRLTKLLEPYGDFSPMGVLWSSVGASRPYEIFTGCAELLAGFLLVFPRTALLGALVCLLDSIEIFTLNMTYDVPVKLFSFHLILMSVFLLAPEMRRMTNFLFSTRPTPASAQPPLFDTPRGNRRAFIAQVVYGLLVFAGYLQGAWSNWYSYGGGAPKSPWYGIWNIEQLTVDGQVKPPLVSEAKQRHYAIFENPGRMAFQMMDQSFEFFATEFDAKTSILTFTSSTDKNRKSQFALQRPSSDQIVLDGEMDGHKLRLALRAVELKKYLLLTRGFHWIQEYPFGR